MQQFDQIIQEIRAFGERPQQPTGTMAGARRSRLVGGDGGCIMRLVVDSALLGMSGRDAERFIRNNGGDVLIGAFRQAKSISRPRGGTGEINCHVDSKGDVHVSGNVSIRF